MNLRFFGVLCFSVLLTTGCTRPTSNQRQAEAIETDRGETTDSSKAASSDAAVDDTYRLSESGIWLAGHQLPFPMTRDALFGVLGDPDRKVSGENTIYSWDAIGVFAYESPGKQIVDEISFAIRPEDFDYFPKSTHIGALEFPGGRISNATSVEMLGTLGFAQQELVSRMPRRSVGNFTIWVIVNDTGEISTVSFSAEPPE